MKKIEIVGYNRANLGRSASNELRADAMVPCVLYGGTEQVSFYSPMILFRELVYTPDVFEVTLNIEGTIYTAILQATQFHPVNDVMLHADFMLITPDKVIKIDVPIKLTGTAIGMTKGGKLNQKIRKLKVQGAAKDIPDYIELSITNLDLGKSIKVSAVVAEGFKILSAPNIPIAEIAVPRALRGK
jgi:large subunit ribosomal protein L25